MFGASGLPRRDKRNGEDHVLRTGRLAVVDAMFVVPFSEELVGEPHGLTTRVVALPDLEQGDTSESEGWCGGLEGPVPGYLRCSLPRRLPGAGEW